MKLKNNYLATISKSLAFEHLKYDSTLFPRNKALNEYVFHSQSENRQGVLVLFSSR